MKRKLKNLSILALTIGSLGFSSVAYANEEQEDVAVGSATTTAEGMFLFERPVFENPIDQMYYDAFGEGFEFIQNHSRQVNRTVYEDGIRMEILSTVTVRQNYSADVNDKSSTTHTSFTFQDETGDRVSADMRININTDSLENGWADAWLVDFNEDTKTATFMATHHFWDTNEVNNNNHQHINITVDNISTDRVEVNEILSDISIADLLNSHNSTFEHNEIRGWGTNNSEKLEELGLDYDDLREGESLKKDELKIPINGWDSAYISNIGIKENILHIQTNAKIGQDIPWWNWYSIDELINTNTQDTIWPIYDLTLDNYDEDWNLIDNREYTEMAFYIEDINELSNYYITLVGSYYDTIIDTNLEISFYSPVIEDNFIIEEEIQISMGEKEVYVSNILISPLEIRFDIGPDGTFSKDDFSFISDNLNLTLIYEDCIKHENAQKRWGHNSWGLEWSSDLDDIFDGMISDLSVTANTVVNTENLVAISINDVVIQVR